MIKFIFLLLLVFSTISSFASIQLDPQEVVPEVVALGINPIVTKEYNPKFSKLKHSEDQYFLKIKIGKITEEQFTALKKLYGNLSKVPFSPDKEYDFTDFLPPSVQAVVDQTFDIMFHSGEFLYEDKYQSRINSLYGHEDDLSYDLLQWYNALQSKGIETSLNCWNTTINNFNAIHGYSTEYPIYLPGRTNISYMFYDTPSDDIKPDDANPWDVFLIRERSVAPDTEFHEIMHAALSVNQHIVFEKTDSTDSDPIRLALRSDLIKKIFETSG